MMRFIGAALVLSTLTSCGSDPNAGLLSIVVVPSQSAVVPADRRGCTDIYENISTKSIASSSVGFASGQISWTDTKRDLYIIKVQLDLENTVVGSKIDITDPDELGRLFGLGVTGEVKIPRMGATGSSSTGLYRTDFKDFNNDRLMDTGEVGCPLAFGGMALPTDTEVTVTGQIRLLGVTQDDAGNQEVVRANSAVSLIISTD